MIEIQIIEPGTPPHTHKLHQEFIALGRNPESDLPLPREEISWQHGQIIQRGNRCYYRDTGSTNGSVLNREGSKALLQPLEEVELQQGDEVALAEETRIVITGLPSRTQPLVRPANEYREIEEEVRRDHVRLQTLCLLERQFAHTTNRDEVLENAARVLLEVFESATHVVVLLAEEGTEEFQQKVAHSRAPRDQRASEIKVSHSILRRALNEKVAILLPDALSEFDSASSVAGLNIRCTMCAPLWTGDRVVGLIEVYSTRQAGCFQETDRDLLAVFANRVAMVLANREIMELHLRQQMLEEMSAFIAHDLRAPLGNIVSGLRIALDMNLVQPDGLDLIHTAIANGERVVGMTEDLVNIHHMECGPLHFARSATQVELICGEAVQQVSYWLTSNKVGFEQEIEPDIPPVHTHTAYAVRILVNLLSNAIYYAKQGQSAQQVSLRVTRQGETIRFEVRDTGPGMSQEDARRVFDKWFQAASWKSGQRISSGLGLTFCKTMVEQLGGQIGVTSEPGQGCTFWFTLPTS